jgi:kynurenine 3-monooxygenase
VLTPKRRNFSRRKENAAALADLAVGNFIQMRDKMASRKFRAKKKLDHLLEGLLPGVYLPLYTTCHDEGRRGDRRRMVTFTRIPYAEAARRARRQDRIVYASLIVALILLSILLFHFLAR